MTASIEANNASPGNPPLGAPFVSYAQNFEDILLARVFAGQQSGFYVDIGAYDPEIGSVTKAFYDRGWRGINIEPGPIFAKLASDRSEDINLNLAVSDHAGQVAFIDDPNDPGQSRIASTGSPGASPRLIACDTLTNILAAYANGRTPDFIKIDVEGAEAAIITSTDWRRIRPTLLIIEATDPWTNRLANQSWEPTLLDQGYHPAYFDGINVFYLPTEHRDLQRHFRLPVNVLDHFVSHNAAFVAQRRALEISQRKRAACDAAYRQSRAEQTVLVNQAQALTAEIAKYQAFQNRLAHQLEWPDAPPALRTALRLARFLNRWGYPPKPATIAPPGAAEPAPPPGLPGRTRLKALLLIAYRPFRPIVRPIAWRLRWFLIGDIRHDLTQLNHHLNQLQHAVTHLHGLTQEAKIPALAQAQSDQLINLVETALVTLALDAERGAADRRMPPNRDDQPSA